MRGSDSNATWKLVPAGTGQVLLCRYDGPFGARNARIADRFRLVGRRLVDSHSYAAELAAELNRLPLVPGGGTAGCPERVAAIVAFFRYPAGPADPVRVELAGCMTVSNGVLTSEAGNGGATILDALEELVHATPVTSSGFSSGGARTATIAGQLRLCGGPAPGRCFSSTVGGCAPPDGCSRSDRVVAIDTAGAIVAEQRLRFPYPDGKFRLQVSPGQYAVELLADGPRIHDRVMQTRGATARARHTARVIFTFDVP